MLFLTKFIFYVLCFLHVLCFVYITVWKMHIKAQSQWCVVQCIVFIKFLYLWPESLFLFFKLTRKSVWMTGIYARGLARFFNESNEDVIRLWAQAYKVLGKNALDQLKSMTLTLGMLFSGIHLYLSSGICSPWVHVLGSSSSSSSIVANVSCIIGFYVQKSCIIHYRLCGEYGG